MISEKSKLLGEYAIECALKAGCQAVKVTIYNSTSDNVEWRNGEMDYVNGAENQSITLSMYVDGRYAIADTNVVEPQALSSFITTNVANTRHLAIDPFRQLTPKALQYDGPSDDLGIYDDSIDRIDFNRRSLVAEALCDEMNHELKILGTAAVSSNDVSSLMMTSNGFIGCRRYTLFSSTASVSVKGHADERPEGYVYTAHSHWSGMEKSGLGRLALKRALDKIGADSIEGGRYAVAVDREVSGRLLSPIISAISGQAQYYQNSFLLNMAGKRIGSDHLTLADIPVRHGMLGSQLFDDDCIALTDMPVIENGILLNYFIGQYMSRKMSATPTRMAPTVLEFGNRQGTQADILKTMDHGILVTGFNGGNCNGTTGDFSFGIEGFEVEHGIVCKPISGMLMTGNMLTLWHNLAAVADDARPYTAWHTPTLLFDGVSVK